MGVRIIFSITLPLLFAAPSAFAGAYDECAKLETVELVKACIAKIDAITPLISEAENKKREQEKQDAFAIAKAEEEARIQAQKEKLDEEKTACGTDDQAGNYKWNSSTNTCDPIQKVSDKQKVNYDISECSNANE